MTYDIIVSRPAEAIEGLSENPYPPQAHKLRAVSEVWRVRVGDWRICYSVEDGRLTVLILMAGQRGDVYERLLRRLG